MRTLIKNEWIKVTKKKSTWIMLGLLVVLTFGLTYVVRLGSPDTKANDLFIFLSDMTSFLNLFVVIVAASAVAEEFSRGTIKKSDISRKSHQHTLICFAWHTGFISKQFSCQQFVFGI